MKNNTNMSLATVLQFKAIEINLEWNVNNHEDLKVPNAK